MERAVLLSDIEFLDGVHESDWERIEEESFLVNVSKPLNENQQIVLEWLKKKYKTTDIEPIELIWRLRVNSNSDKWRLQPPYKNYRYLTEIAQFQVLAVFAEWGGRKYE
jgi:hypothetical protein|nr:MAG TPA: hypothetical protein [Caudoviricetes sp.]